MSERSRRAGVGFYAIPAFAAAAAGYFAWRAFRERQWEAMEAREPTNERPEVVLAAPCAPGRYWCLMGVRGGVDGGLFEGEVAATTGEHAGDYGDSAGGCALHAVGTCTKGCVAESVSLAGPALDAETARRQLCDPPAEMSELASEVSRPLVADGGGEEACEGDGFAPTDDGVMECVLRSRADRASLGVVVGRVHCRRGVVATVDRAPRLVSRDQAVAIWCKR